MTSKVINVEKSSRRKIKKDRKIILKEERLKEREKEKKLGSSLTDTENRSIEV